MGGEVAMRACDERMLGDDGEGRHEGDGQMREGGRVRGEDGNVVGEGGCWVLRALAGGVG